MVGSGRNHGSGRKTRSRKLMLRINDAVLIYFLFSVENRRPLKVQNKFTINSLCRDRKRVLLPFMLRDCETRDCYMI